MAIILNANKVNLFVFSVLFVFWYHSPNVLDTPRKYVTLLKVINRATETLGDQTVTMPLCLSTVPQGLTVDQMKASE
jgi:hypothetical protein